jgi:hypothetical protein
MGTMTPQPGPLPPSVIALACVSPVPMLVILDLAVFRWLYRIELLPLFVAQGLCTLVLLGMLFGVPAALFRALTQSRG